MTAVVLQKIYKIIENAKGLGPYTVEEETAKRLNVKAADFVRKREDVLGLLMNAFDKANAKPKLVMKKDDKSVTSSKGGIVFPQSEYKGYVIQAKDDTAKKISTEEQETVAAYYIALRIMNKKPNYSSAELNGVKNKVISKQTYSQIESKVSASWANSAKQIAEHIMERDGGFIGLPTSKSFTLQHPSGGTGFIDKIYKLFTKYIKETEVSFMKRDKWNPGDIWYVHDSVNESDLDDKTSVVSLNKYLVKQYKAGNVIPISLKKIVNENIKTLVKNLDEDLPKLKFEKADMGKQSFFKSIDANIFFNGSIAECRTFTGDSLSAEIKGVGAKAGKIGANIINIFFKKYNSKKMLTNYKELAPRITKKRTQFIKELHQLAIRTDPRIKNIKLDEFMMSLDESKYAPAGSQPEFNYLNSKYQAAELVDAINSLSKKNRDDIIDDMMSYAGSVTDLSSVHIVIRN